MKDLLLKLIICLLCSIYVSISEIRIIRLKNENQLQRITIETNEKILKKQAKIIGYSKTLQQNKNVNKKELQQLTEESRNKITNANNLVEKQKLLNCIL